MLTNRTQISRCIINRKQSGAHAYTAHTQIIKQRFRQESKSRRKKEAEPGDKQNFLHLDRHKDLFMCDEYFGMT